MPTNPEKAAKHNLIQRRMRNIASEFKKADPDFRRKGNIIYKVIGGYYVFLCIDTSGAGDGHRYAHFECQPLFGLSTTKIIYFFCGERKQIKGNVCFRIVADDEECLDNQQELQNLFIAYSSQFKSERDCYLYCMKEFGSTRGCTLAKLSSCI